MQLYSMFLRALDQNHPVLPPKVAREARDPTRRMLAWRLPAAGALVLPILKTIRARRVPQRMLGLQRSAVAVGILAMRSLILLSVKATALLAYPEKIPAAAAS